MGMQQNIREDSVGEVELRELIAVKPRTTVREAMTLMRKKKLGCVIVVDDYNRPVGKYTERKLMSLLLDSPSKLDEPIERHMYPSANPVMRREPIAVMIKQMESRGIRFVCVCDDDGKAVALSGQKGLMEYVAEHFPRQIKVQLMEGKLSMDQREGA